MHGVRMIEIPGVLGVSRGVWVKTKRDKQQEEPGKVTRRDEGKTWLPRTRKK